jgi:hypothetical protein
MTIDPHFEPNEALYRRIQPGSYPVTEATIQKLIVFPDCSVNRSKYSQPEDVLKPDYLHWGILEFLVKDVPTILQEGESSSSFLVVHCPLEDNYAHSEIQSYKGEHLKEPSKTLKTRFRDAIRKNHRVLRAPSMKPSDQD